MIQKLYETLCNINGSEQVLRDEPMSRHTTFRIGGPAALFCIPRSVPALAATVKACIEADIPYYILGNGSNVLVSDAGYQGVVIQLFRNMDGIRIRGTEMEVEAGALLVKIAHTAAKESLTGLEFASGIPGTLGGGLTMNAGAYGGEMKDVVKEAVVMKPDGEILQPDKGRAGAGIPDQRHCPEGLSGHKRSSGAKGGRGGGHPGTDAGAEGSTYLQAAPGICQCRKHL